MGPVQLGFRPGSARCLGWSLCPTVSPRSTRANRPPCSARANRSASSAGGRVRGRRRSSPLRAARASSIRVLADERASSPFAFSELLLDRLELSTQNRFAFGPLHRRTELGSSMLFWAATASCDPIELGQDLLGPSDAGRWSTAHLLFPVVGRVDHVGEHIRQNQPCSLHRARQAASAAPRYRRSAAASLHRAKSEPAEHPEASTRSVATAAATLRKRIPKVSGSCDCGKCLERIRARRLEGQRHDDRPVRPSGFTIRDRIPMGRQVRRGSGD